MGKTTGFDEEVYRVIEKLAIKHSNKYYIPLHSKDDIKQEIRRICLEALEKYEKGRGPLENYLSRCVANRMKNLCRDRFVNTTTPCSSRSCPYLQQDGSCPRRDTCPHWKRYLERIDNQAKVRSPVNSFDFAGFSRRDGREAILEYELVEDAPPHLKEEVKMVAASGIGSLFDPSSKLLVFAYYCLALDIFMDRMYDSGYFDEIQCVVASGLDSVTEETAEAALEVLEGILYE